MPQNALVVEFGQGMLRIYERALSEAHYQATRFLSMFDERRGLETARILINASTVSDGYTALWERKRLDLTVEAVSQVASLVHRRRARDLQETPHGLRLPCIAINQRMW